MAGLEKFEAPWRPNPPEPHDPARALTNLFEARKRTVDNRVRTENLLSAAAAVTGEFSLKVVGDIDAYHHDFPPGSTVLSDKVDHLLFAGQQDRTALPETTVFGALRKEALYRGFEDSDFPAIPDILQLIDDQTNGGDPGPGWGRVPLNVGSDHLPRISPMQDAYLLRKLVNVQLTNWGVPRREQAQTCARATGMVLGRIRTTIDPKLALQIVFATVSGVAKMAPMTARHMKIMQLRVGKGRVVF
jgi:hypothetical protein